MWIRVILAPWWVRALIATAIVGACVFASIVLLWSGDGGFGLPIGGVLLIVLGCLIVGALLGFAMGQQSHLYAEALTVTSTPAERSEAIDAVWRGPIPENSRAREAARRIAQIQMALHDKNRRMIHIVYPLLAVLWVFLTVLAVVNDEPGRALWNAGLAALWTYATVWTLTAERRMQNRVEKLRAA